MKSKAKVTQSLTGENASNQHWKNARFDCFYYDDGALRDQPCEVRIGGDEIVVSYRVDGGYVNYVGKAHGDGHYILQAPEINGSTSLHRLSQDSECLDGFWKEGELKGMWRIKLN